MLLCSLFSPFTLYARLAYADADGRRTEIESEQRNSLCDAAAAAATGFLHDTRKRISCAHARIMCVMLFFMPLFSLVALVYSNFPDSFTLPFY